MQTGTVWYRQKRNSDGVVYWDFNHFSVSIETGDRPVVKHPNHDTAWSGGVWMRKLCTYDASPCPVVNESN